MKFYVAIFALFLMVLSGCAHNPRPESPEQRAERQAQSLQAQQDAQGEPRSIDYATRNEAESERDRQQQAANEQDSEESTAAEARKQTAATRATLRSVRVPVTSTMTGVTGGILR